MANSQQKDLTDILNNNKEPKKSGSNKKLENNDNEKDKGGRIPKEIKYVKERQELLNKLLKILGISETNKVFYVDDLDKDDAKQKQILDLVEDVKQYFTYGKWVYFTKDNVPEPCLSLAKSILKDMGYILTPFYPKVNLKTKRKALIIEKKQ